MAYTEDDISELEAALAAGVLSISHSGRTVTFTSRADMKAQLREMKREVRGSSPQPVAGVASFGRGDR